MDGKPGAKKGKGEGNICKTDFDNLSLALFNEKRTPLFSRMMHAFLADQGKTGMKVISGLLRYKNLKTNENYLHSIDESQRMAKAQFEGKFTPKNEKWRHKSRPKKFKESPDVGKSLILMVGAV